jgi:hypothetical protein
MPNEPPDTIETRTYPYAYGYCLGYVSVMLDKSEQIVFEAKNIDNPKELRLRVNRLHALIRNAHTELTRLNVTEKTPSGSNRPLPTVSQ